MEARWAPHVLVHGECSDHGLLKACECGLSEDCKAQSVCLSRAGPLLMFETAEITRCDATLAQTSEYDRPGWTGRSFHIQHTAPSSLRSAWQTLF